MFCSIVLNRRVTNVLPAKSDSDVMFCLQSYHGLIIDRSLVYSSYLQDRINTQVIYQFAPAYNLMSNLYPLSVYTLHCKTPEIVLLNN